MTGQAPDNPAVVQQGPLERNSLVSGEAGRPDSGLVTEAINALSKKTDDESYKNAFGIITKTEPSLLPNQGTIDFGNGQSIYETKDVQSTKGGKTNVLTIVDDQTANGGKLTTAYIGEDGSHQRFEYDPAAHTVKVFTGSDDADHPGKTYSNVLEPPKMNNGAPEIMTPNGTVTVDGTGREIPVAPPVTPQMEQGKPVINGRELPNPPNGGIKITPTHDGQGTYVDSRGDTVTVYPNGVTMTDESKRLGKDPQGALRYRDGFGREFYTSDHGAHWTAYAGEGHSEVGITAPVVTPDGVIKATHGADVFSMGDGDRDHESHWND